MGIHQGNCGCAPVRRLAPEQARTRSLAESDGGRHAATRERAPFERTPDDVFVVFDTKGDFLHEFYRATRWC